MDRTVPHTTNDAQTSAQDRANRRLIGYWLLACAAMVFAMAVIGAITRLTESGLSIMEWAPFSGALPPLSTAEWERLFALYQQIPEYQEENRGMALAEFKTIFWWEYIHRLWGRLIGLVFGLPLLWFVLTKRIPSGLTGRLVFLFVLGAAQGAMGWYMVASGFADRTDVSQYRLVAHLGLAVVIYGALLWTAFPLLAPQDAQLRSSGSAAVRGWLVGATFLVFITIVSGGFVAGLNAGLIYNTFPLMNGDFVPADYAHLDSWPLNAMESVAAVQFHHRWLAVFTVAALVVLWLWARRKDLTEVAQNALTLVPVFGLLQLGLGIATLLLVVPIWLGALHQAGALLVLTACLWALYRVR